MALKIVQTIEAVNPPNNGISTSGAISLQTGYLRLSASGGNAHVVILEDGVTGTATSESSFIIPENTSEILKYRASRQAITGVTTGATTTLSFGENNGVPFNNGDRITVEGTLEPVGLGTTLTYVEVLSQTSNSMVVDADTTWVGVVTLSSNIAAKSVKVEAVGESSNVHVHIAEVQIVSN